MIIFLLVALSIYALVNFYVLKREWQATALLGKTRIWVFALSLFIVLAFPLGRLTERIFPGWVTEFIDRIGAFYLVIMLYSFLLILIVDLLRLGNAFFPFFPKSIVSQPQKAGFITFLIVIGIVLATMAGGTINNFHPRLRDLRIVIDKSAGPLKELKIALASDFHLGTINRDAWLNKVVGMINDLHPDLVVLPGDVVDMYVPHAEGEHMISTLQRIKAPLGVFSVTGNHEYYGGIEKNLQYLAKARIRVLQDEVLKINDVFYLIGRKDRTAESFGGGRKPLPEILKGVDPSLPLILLDHQPYHLKDAEDAGIDLQLSGHTHAGQLFPLNLLNKKIWEQYWGYLLKGKTQYYVSCGVGTWGPPVRTGSRPEVVLVKLVFNGKG
jgi:predicted MPP superfamily phosphohydrolase